MTTPFASGGADGAGGPGGSGGAGRSGRAGAGRAGVVAATAPGELRFPTSWYPLCRSSAVRGGTVVRLRAFGMPLAVFRGAGNRVAALDARCSHMGADLSRGRVAGERLQCPLHHWEYGARGRCERIPGLDGAPPAAARQTALVCEEHYGLIFGFLRGEGGEGGEGADGGEGLEGGEPAFPFPRFAGEDDPPLASRASVMSFPAPYQVLAANSFDSQHFATVHHRPLREPPTLTAESRYHLGVRFRARVEGGRFHDRLLRGIGVEEVDLSADCWGGNTILATNHRTGARILFAVLPVDAASSRIFVLNVLGRETAARLPRAARGLLVGAMHRLTMAFLAPDVAVMRELRWELGALLPDLDRPFVEWIRYWQALPTAAPAAARLARRPASSSAAGQRRAEDSPAFRSTGGIKEAEGAGAAGSDGGAGVTGITGIAGVVGSGRGAGIAGRTGIVMAAEGAGAAEIAGSAGAGPRRAASAGAGAGTDASP